MTDPTAGTEDVPDFEAALAELEEIVGRLERGEITLELALEQFERGVGLVRQCTQTLNTMELRVEQLRVTEDGEILTEPFDTADDETPTGEHEGREG